jgi:hypothetical protein
VIPEDTQTAHQRELRYNRAEAYLSLAVLLVPLPVPDGL